jgi:type II secretory pathway predicted ATPase ExeA
VSNVGELELDSLSGGLRYPDPFGPTANLAAYVPCKAMERALFELLHTVRSERRAAAISGPPGLGKTLLLHLLADRLSPQLHFVYIPYPALPPDGLCTWALDLLGTQASDDPIAMLKAYGEHLRRQGSALLLLIDDAGALPVDSARMFGNLVAASDGGLRLAVASTDSPEASRPLAALGSDINMIRLIEPMTEAETRRYLESRLAMACVADAICAYFDDETMAALHRMSSGVPRRLNALASAVMRGIPSEAAAARLDGEGAEDAVRASEPPPPPAPEPIVADVAVAPEPAPVEEPKPPPPAPEPEPIPVEVSAVPEPVPAPAEVAAALEPEPVEEPKPPPPAPEPEPIPVEVSAVPEPVPAAAPEPEPLEEPKPSQPAPLPRALPAFQPTPRTLLVGAAVMVAFLLAIFILRPRLAAPPEPWAAAVPAAEEVSPEVAPEPAATDERQRIGLERVPAEPVEVAVDTGAPPAQEETATAVTQPDVDEVAEEETVAVHTEAPPLQDEIATAAVQPDLASFAEDEPAEPEAPGPESQAPAVSFPVQVNATPWATIEIDGQDFGETPLAGIPLPGGPHSFRARMPDGRVVERVVEIDAENRFVVFE